MIAEVKSIELIDYENWIYWPDDIEKFCVAAEAMIGPVGEEGADIFSFEICTPKWFEEERNEKAAFARAVVFLRTYDELAAKTIIRKLVDTTSGDTWIEIAQKLNRYLRWEFEDYKA
ncbi:Imm8 family immunity protein [Rhizobium sp. G187]|uniref:Imm8 family immunity protein n=1 Tax=Rhizobium sp. G187 TaxID=3451352 RepID=UPI003EE4DF2E